MFSFESVVYCGTPRVDSSIRIMGRGYYYGNSVVYMCRPGLTPQTHTVLTCMANGQWDKTPGCKGK